MESVTLREMRIMDANSEWFGVPVSELMENAGRGIAAEANKLGKSFVVICGPGNNGGDGFAAARYLKSKPKVFYFWTPKSNEAYDNFLKAKNYRPTQIKEDNLADLEKAIKESDVVVDAIFGTGIKDKLREPVRSVVEMINKFGKKVLTIDVPSGMDPDTGRINDLAVKADVTVFMHAPKKGLPKIKIGRTAVVDIGIHPKSFTHIGKGDFKFGYPKRKENARKGRAGKVMVVGGSENYTGAPYFTAMAALKSGCDLAYVAAPEEAAERIATLGPDLIVYPLEDETILSKRDAGKVLSRKFDVLCIGNGLGRDSESLEAAKIIVSKCKKPVVVDGDGLRAIKPILSKLKKSVILTPHGGEFKELFKLLPNERNLKKVAKKYKCVILLKGATDIIAQGNKVKYNDSGNPYMSKGGTGDVLAGLCAGFMAQGLEPFQAACFAALVNGVAGDLAYTEESIGLTASDVLSHVGMAERILLE